MSRSVKDLKDMVCSSRQSVQAVDNCHDTASDDVLTEDFAQSPDDLLTSYAKLPDIINECGLHAHNRVTAREKASLRKCSHVKKVTSCGMSSGLESLEPHYNTGQFLENNTSESLTARRSHCMQNDCWGSVSVKPGGMRPPTGCTRQSCPSTNVNYESESSLLPPPRTSLETGDAYDDILKHLSQDIVQAWLERVKFSIIDASNWCQSGDNFVQFAHSWLSQCSEHTRNERLDLEFSNFRDQIQLAFRGKRVSGSTLDSLLEVVLHEFANGRFFGHKGAYLFLEYLDILTSSLEYQPRLLADVHCSPTAMKLRNYDCILGIRSFAICGIWFALLDKYRGDEDLAKSSQCEEKGKPHVLPAETRSKSAQSRAAHQSIVDNPSRNPGDLSRDRIFQAIQLGFVDVMQFLVDTRRVSTDVRDSSNKTLVFYAAASGQPAALRYLLQQTNCGLCVNVSADSGNTPLHAATNRGDVCVTRELLKVKDIKVDACNHLCENATPLHLAAMHGHEELVLLLIKAGANPSKKMGSKSVADVASDFEHSNIVELLRKQTSTPRLP